MAPRELFVGIDVAKAHLDWAVRPTGEIGQVSHDEPGMGQLIARLQEVDPTLVVLEATGGLEWPLVAALGIAGVPVAVVNPRQVRDFAKATGQLAKTDRLDARVLAHFADAVRPKPRPLPDAQTQEWAALLSRRQQLIQMLTAEKNRLGSALPQYAPASTPISSGWNRNWGTWSRAWASASSTAPCGGPKMTCCKAPQALARWSP
jgi:transposase